MEKLYVQNGVVSAVVHPRTNRRDLYFSTFITRVANWYKEVAQAEGLSDDDIANYVTAWARMLSRCEFDGLTQEIPTITDTPDEVRAKFLCYLDSEHAIFFERVKEAMDKQDQPVDVTIAPAPLEKTAKKKT